MNVEKQHISDSQNTTEGSHKTIKYIVYFI